MVAAANEKPPGQSYAPGWTNVFVSGGAGFIGSHLVRWLLEDERVQRVVIFDNFSSGQLSYIEEITNDPRLEIAKADLKELGAVTSAMAGCDTVFHLAANPDIARAVTQPDIDFWEGTYLTQNVLEAMRVNNVRKIFYTSGSGVYGENPEVAFGEELRPLHSNLDLRREQAGLRRSDRRLLPHVWAKRPRLPVCQCGRAAADPRCRLRFHSSLEG